MLLLEVHSQFGAQPTPCSPPPLIPPFPNCIHPNRIPAKGGGGGWGWGCKGHRCEQPCLPPWLLQVWRHRADSEEPGPRCQSDSKATPASHNILPGLECSSRGAVGTQTWHRPCHSLPPNVGCCIIQRGETDMRRRSPACVTWGSQEEFCCSLQPLPPIPPFLSTPNSSPRSCCAAGCGFARLPCYTQRPLRLVTAPTLHCPALNHINPTNPPPENLTHHPTNP